MSTRPSSVTFKPINVTPHGLSTVKIAAYLRVSTELQTGPDKYGIDAQRSDVEAFARAQGAEVVRWYVDEAESGTKLDRPALLDLLADAEGDAFEGVAVAKLDRLSRDLFGQLYIEDQLRKSSVVVLSASEPDFKDDPQGRLFRNLLGAFAEYEVELIRARLFGGRREKAKRGGYAGHKPPLGYTASAKQLKLDEGEAGAVRLIFDLYTQPGRKQKNKSLRQIASEVNEAGYRTKTGREFGAVAIKRILDRRDFYAGAYHFAGIEARGQHTPVL